MFGAKSKGDIGRKGDKEKKVAKGKGKRKLKEVGNIEKLRYLSLTIK